MSELNASVPLVSANGTPTQYFLLYLKNIERYMPLFGDGSPEGVVEAPLYSLYIDKSGGAGGIEYRKMAASVSNDRKQGWELV